MPSEPTTLRGNRSGDDADLKGGSPMGPRQTTGDAPHDWKAAYDALADHSMEVYGIVFAMLTDPEGRYGTEDERLAVAANEVQWAAKNLEARLIFDRAGIAAPSKSRPLTDEEERSGIIDA